jgi:hypothetical protein
MCGLEKIDLYCVCVRVIITHLTETTIILF